MQDAQFAPMRTGRLFDQVGAFLDAHHLSPDPVHYCFAFAVVSAPGSALARRVAELTQGGVRLKRLDIEMLGGRVVGDGAVELARPEADPIDDRAAELVEETQNQVDGFAKMVRDMRAETQGFGRDLERSAAAIFRVPQIAEIDAIASITTRMIARIHDSEVRLAQATEEADALRTKLVEARETARRDTLTGLPNRRAFEEAFAERDADAGPYCLAVCDIDRFKRINDEFGHGVGDRVLSAIGQAIAAECSPHLVVRHGGEEFAVLLRGMNLVEAADLLDNVRATVAAKRFRNRDSDAPMGQITFSAGITAIQVSDTVETAFARADRLLYTAKNSGRDQVSAA
ncbi:GGDEF domain-containing protein [Sphingomonas sp. R86521]|uniref:GGDEF domain-containing protein n=1 Tax=Sphingomonas sp. R86521 TaxID=3093860 RepID=UPI0036D28CA0